MKPVQLERYSVVLRTHSKVSPVVLWSEGQPWHSVFDRFHDQPWRANDFQSLAFHTSHISDSLSNVPSLPHIRLHSEHPAYRALALHSSSLQPSSRRLICPTQHSPSVPHSGTQPPTAVGETSRYCRSSRIARTSAQVPKTFA